MRGALQRKQTAWTMLTAGPPLARSSSSILADAVLAAARTAKARTMIVTVQSKIARQRTAGLSQLSVEATRQSSIKRCDSVLRLLDNGKIERQMKAYDVPEMALDIVGRHNAPRLVVDRTQS